ncbi:hypothetical protein V2J09_004597 [Rumex salicifolius]
MASTMGVGFEITELRLGLPGESGRPEKKRAFSEINNQGEKEGNGCCMKEEVKASVVVGWPPVCSYRRLHSVGDGVDSSKAYIKVSMDGVPFLRKVDISSHQGYTDLVAVLEKLFGYPGFGDAIKAYDNSEFVPIYEDEDGDWMLLGDVPWKMFLESCKRLRIMKKSEAKGIGLQSKKHKDRN